MVIGPNELYEVVRNEEAASSLRLERKIDSRLRKEFDGENDVWIEGEQVTGVKKLVLEGVLNSYRQSGWRVEHISCPQDGESYKFTPRVGYGGGEE